ncbi:hypothetical protein F5Y18DRAFT_20375 [Xylariaceae sp. FL1019]|nr:hypothetical protein F5Y18DRAFT_20375 [Xylariaceae sp. FL1019]
MTSLSSLPTELLLEVASYLVYHEPEPLCHRLPFHEWETAIEEQEPCVKDCFRDLSSLSISCRRLHQAVGGLLSSRLVTGGWSDHAESVVCDVAKKPDLAVHIRDVYIRSMWDTQPWKGFWLIFSLPSLQTLTIHGDFMRAVGWDPEVIEPLIGASSVQILRLCRSVNSKEMLTQILRFPRALKELWYEIDAPDWDKDLDGPFTCAALEWALSPQAESLEKLVLTRPVAVQQPDALDLRRFPKLKTLCHYHMLTHSADEWNRLPPNIEDLEVFYDDDDVSFTYPHDFASGPSWLIALLEEMVSLNGDRQKSRYLPKLKRIRIFASEGDYFDESLHVDEEIPGFDERRGITAPNSPWKPPSTLIKLFLSAGVSFSIFLNEKMHYRYTINDDDSFQSVWEDDWTWEHDWTW